MLAPVLAGLRDLVVADRLWTVTKDILRSFYSPSLPWRPPASVQVGLMVFGVFLLAAGAGLSARGRGWFWKTLAVAGAAALAGWALMGGREDVLGFFAVILLVLRFFGGITLVLGALRSAWVWVLLLLSILVAATGAADPAVLGLGLGALASLLGAWSLYRKAEEISPGKRGSRWNRVTALGWAACLLAAGMLEPRGVGAWGREFQVAGMVVGVALAVLAPSLLRRGRVELKVSKR